VRKTFRSVVNAMRKRTNKKVRKSVSGQPAFEEEEDDRTALDETYAYVVQSKDNTQGVL